jgi:hypothetical protein
MYVVFDRSQKGTKIFDRSLSLRLSDLAYLNGKLNLKILLEVVPENCTFVGIEYNDSKWLYIDIKEEIMSSKFSMKKSLGILNDMLIFP